MFLYLPCHTSRHLYHTIFFFIIIHVHIVFTSFFFLQVLITQYMFMYHIKFHIHAIISIIFTVYDQISFYYLLGLWTLSVYTYNLITLAWRNLPRHSRQSISSIPDRGLMVDTKLNLSTFFFLSLDFILYVSNIDFYILLYPFIPSNYYISCYITIVAN